MTWLAERWLKWRGWQFEGQFPDLPKMIVVGAPHTSNWDFVLFLGAIRHWSISPSFIGKHTLFRWPFGYLFRRWGGIPVDRSASGGLVGEVARSFERSDRLTLVISPEATRSSATHWKSGFVEIARVTGAPIVPVYIDYLHKRVVLGTAIAFDGDQTGLMDTLREFFKSGVGRNPEGAGPVRLRDERAVS